MNKVIFNHINNAIRSLEEALQITVAPNSESRSSAEQLPLEVKWTNFLQNLVDILNFYSLRNFSLRSSNIQVLKNLKTIRY
jgi:hypothetical protein